MIIGSDEKLEIGKVYTGLNNMECEFHSVRYMVLRVATVDEWKQEIANLGNAEVNKFEQKAIDRGEAFFYEVSID